MDIDVDPSYFYFSINSIPVIDKLLGGVNKTLGAMYAVPGYILLSLDSM